MEGPVRRDRFLTLEELTQARALPTRDCRRCERFRRDEAGFDCGWCDAHSMWVKLYQSPAEWYSQCQFLQIRKERRR